MQICGTTCDMRTWLKWAKDAIIAWNWHDYVALDSRTSGRLDMHSVSESTTHRRYFCSISCSMNSVCSRSSFTRDSCWIRSLQPQTTSTTVNLGLYDQYLHVGLRFTFFYFIFCKALSGKQPTPSHAWSAHVGLGYATDVKRCKFKKNKETFKKIAKSVPRVSMRATWFTAGVKTSGDYSCQ